MDFVWFGLCCFTLFLNIQKRDFLNNKDSCFDLSFDCFSISSHIHSNKKRKLSSQTNKKRKKKKEKNKVNIENKIRARKSSEKKRS